MLDHLLLSVALLSLVLWVGGAVTGQIMLIRARTTGNQLFSAHLILIINWLIPSVYVPASLLAVTSGIWLMLRQGAPLLEPWPLYLFVVYLATVLMGSFYSLPEYKALSAKVKPGMLPSSDVQRRLTRASLLNRLELLLVSIGLVGLVFTLPF